MVALPTMPSPPSLPPRTDPTRTSKRPTTAFSPFLEHRIQEVLLNVFKRNGTEAIDMEALIYFTLREFDVSHDTYEQMYKSIRAHILKHFAIHQGSSLRLSDFQMRRLTVCLTTDD